jgi:hypothetical protein
MISTALAVLSAAFAIQASDTTRASREAFTGCLRAFVEASLRENKTQAAFDTEFPQACAPQQAAFRQAIIRRDTALRATRASAEDAANLEVEDARFNFSERFAMSLPAQPRAEAQASVQAPANPQVQPASQTAGAQPTVQPASQPQ